MTSRKEVLITPTLLLALTLATSSIVAVPAFAAGPHFVGTPTITKNPNLSLTANFKATGLANLPTRAFLTSSSGNTVVQCVSTISNPRPPIQVNFGPLTADIPTHNGQFSASASIGPPQLPTVRDAGCPGGIPDPHWTIKVLSLTYENVVLHIQHNDQDILTFNFGNVDP